MKTKRIVRALESAEKAQKLRMLNMITQDELIALRDSIRATLGLPPLLPLVPGESQ